VFESVLTSLIPLPLVLLPSVKVISSEGIGGESEGVGGYRGGNSTICVPCW